MFARSLFVVAAVAVAAVYVPGLAGTYLAPGEAPDKAPEPETAAAPAQPASTARYTGSRGVTLEADDRGHFSGLFTINGRKVEGMVDTGASMVAINLSTAERLGFSRNKLEFRYAVDTANGRARAAYVRLDSVSIGSITVSNVGAMVLDDKALDGMLVGMTFLKGLASYQVDGSSMRLIR
ncbi:aspartyl protease family protein [Rhizobium subbaraonis]|uniref:Aspartyl protease family protein n=1 Tax=Rhizobium subbaraonis TaxID=908946 RepID=A0A285UGU2_9HYPH|nr:TIGR02281 family clan AA aspartic protease [Rhizobium subbaraonis]SOC41135.1 aspartyl protease family protein [Rhizobium subbaraonis]